MMLTSVEQMFQTYNRLKPSDFTVKTQFKK
jgi:hypothetical protein